MLVMKKTLVKACLAYAAAQIQRHPGSEIQNGDIFSPL